MRPGMSVAVYKVFFPIALQPWFESTYYIHLSALLRILDENVSQKTVLSVSGKNILIVIIVKFCPLICSHIHLFILFRPQIFIPKVC